MVISFVFRFSLCRRPTVMPKRIVSHMCSPSLCTWEDLRWSVYLMRLTRWTRSLRIKRFRLTSKAWKMIVCFCHKKRAKLAQNNLHRQWIATAIITWWKFNFPRRFFALSDPRAMGEEIFGRNNVIQLVTSAIVEAFGEWEQHIARNAIINNP